MSCLFSPFELGSLNLANRIVIAPMCQYSAKEGLASDWHLIHMGNLALSGAGLFIIEATAVSPEGRISIADLGLWSDETEGALKRILNAVRQYSVVPLAIQLAHAGRKGSTSQPWLGGHFLTAAEGGWSTVAPSALAFNDNGPAPHALNEEGIAKIIDDFANAAKRAYRLGFEAIEVHSAHGYLLHEFLSPLSNQRRDHYGGSLENRLRFPLEVFEAVRAAVPATLPVGIRISATDWVEGGWDLQQSLVFAQALSERECTFIHVSSGGLSPKQQIPATVDYQIPFSKAIRQQTGLPTIAVGLITQAQQADAIINGGDADLIGIARGILYDPRWPWHAAEQLNAQVSAPPQYWRSAPQGLETLFKR